MAPAYGAAFGGIDNDQPEIKARQRHRARLDPKPRYPSKDFHHQEFAKKLRDPRARFPPPAAVPIVRSSPAHHLPHVNPNRGRSGGLKGLVHIYVKSICVLGTPPLSHQLPSQPGQSDQQTGDFAHFTQQRSYGRQFAYSSCSEPKMGRLCVYHDHLAAQSILVND